MTQTVTSQLGEALTGSRLAGDVIDAVVSIVSGIGVARSFRLLANAARAELACAKATTCFTEGTQIVVGMGYDEDGNVLYDTKNIEDIAVGDLVYSYNTLTGELEQSAVAATYVLESDHIDYLTFIDEDDNEQIIETTDVHPFWVVTDDPDLSRAARSIVDENGVWLYHEGIGPTEHGFWVEAKDLRVGDVVLGADGRLSTLQSTLRVSVSRWPRTAWTVFRPGRGSFGRGR